MVITWLNKQIDAGGYPFEQVTGEPSIAAQGKTTRFPDVQLWINREAGDGFCCWELKTPTTAIDDAELLKAAKEKAERMHARYFVTWNMREAAIWEIVQRKEGQTRLLTYPAQAVSSVEEFRTPHTQTLLEQRARDILNDLARLQREGHLTYIGADDWFFIHRLTEATHRILPYFKEQLMQKSARDATFRSRLNAWAVKQGLLVEEDQEAFYTKIGAQLVYQLLGRILFFEVLRRFRSDIGELKLDRLSEEQAHRHLHEKFAEVRSIDYQAIFEVDLPDEIPVPKGALPVIVELIRDFERRDFAHLPQEVLGSVFENLIPPEERHRLGQYFTPENLVDFIVAFCVRTGEDIVLGPRLRYGNVPLAGLQSSQVAIRQAFTSASSHAAVGCRHRSFSCRTRDHQPVSARCIRGAEFPAYSQGRLLQNTHRLAV